VESFAQVYPQSLWNGSWPPILAFLEQGTESMSQVDPNILKIPSHTQLNIILIMRRILWASTSCTQAPAKP